MQLLRLPPLGSNSSGSFSSIAHMLSCWTSFLQTGRRLRRCRSGTNCDGHCPLGPGVRSRHRNCETSHILSGRCAQKYSVERKVKTSAPRPWRQKCRQKPFVGPSRSLEEVHGCVFASRGWAPAKFLRPGCTSGLFASSGFTFVFRKYFWAHLPYPESTLVLAFRSLWFVEHALPLGLKQGPSD